MFKHSTGCCSASDPFVTIYINVSLYSKQLSVQLLAAGHKDRAIPFLSPPHFSSRQRSYKLTLSICQIRKFSFFHRPGKRCF
ncbi:hypothetical protein F0562_001378 [Nyssa sinensis]|uniref:Uncharacterized protein n=1 Tax=Nyssa sinensis TaxID=561372 RepID=A0A5J5C463_9ASTE|nr:hypothetical protein F0562_001378 [Nyssa sinensis]